MKDHPELRGYETFNADFGEKEWTLLLLQTDSVFDPYFLRDLSNLSRELERVEHVNKVISLSNVRDSRISKDGMLTYLPLYSAQEANQLLSNAEMETFRNRLYENPNLEGTIFRRSDPKSTMVLLKTDNFINSPEPYRIQMVDAVKNVLSRYPSVRHYSLAGTSVVNAELNRASLHDVFVFYALVTLFTVVAGYICLRNWRDLSVLLGVVICSSLPPMAILALLKIPYNLVTVMLPPVLITLSVCDVVHVINAFHYERKMLMPDHAIDSAVRKVWVPCLWTSLITIIGFISFSASTVVPICQMGIVSAFGILLVWLMTMSYVPVLLVILWPSNASSVSDSNGSKETGLYAKRIMPLLRGRYRWLWLIIAALTLFCLRGIYYVEVDTDYTKFFGKGMYISKAYPEIRSAGYGQSPVAIVLDFPVDKNFTTQGYYRSLLRFQDSLRKDPEIVKLLSITDLLARADLAFNGIETDMAGYSSEKLSQLYLLAEMAGNDDLKDFVTSDKRRLQVVAMTPYMSSKQLDAFKKRVLTIGYEFLPQEIQLKVTGTTVQWANMDKEISRTQLYSLFILSLVFLVLLPIIFKSWLLGIIGVTINTLPMAITYGLMGILGIKINMATTLIAGVAIGSTVDSTIFFINRVRLGLAEGLCWSDAVDYAVNTVGDGIIMTSAILAGGFFSLTISDFLPTSQFGGLVTVSIVIAFFMDIIVNPIVLKLVGSRGNFAYSSSSAAQVYSKGEFDEETD